VPAIALQTDHGGEEMVLMHGAKEQTEADRHSAQCQRTHARRHRREMPAARIERPEHHQREREGPHEPERDAIRTGTWWVEALLQQVVIDAGKRIQRGPCPGNCECPQPRIPPAPGEQEGQARC
jgi:hypothetical protein